MFDLILNCIFYGFLAAFWIAIFFAGRAVVRGIRSRRYGRSTGFCFVVCGLLWAGLHMGLTPGASAYARYRYTHDLFGRSFALSSPRLSYYSSRDFHGDGYSIEVFKTSETLSRWASSPPADFTATYPVRPSYRSHWSGVHWRQTPISADDRKFLEFALSEHAGGSDLKAAKELLERLANEPGHYFAYFNYMHEEHVGDLDFFLLSPSKRVFILVNSNT